MKFGVVVLVMRHCLRKQSAPESARTQAIPHASEAGQIFQPLTPTVLSEDQRRFV